MQMSKERFREIHKLIWTTVIIHAREVKEGRSTVEFLKEIAVNKAYDRGLLDPDEVKLIAHNDYCLLCASCKLCRECVLRKYSPHCGDVDSLFQRSRRGDKDAMIKIRDIVDKKPFTELSIITLYDVVGF